MDGIMSGTRGGGRARTEGHTPLREAFRVGLLSSPFLSSSSFLSTFQAKIEQMGSQLSTPGSDLQ